MIGSGLDEFTAALFLPQTRPEPFPAANFNVRGSATLSAGLKN
jgi:hypothetical protein